MNTTPLDTDVSERYHDWYERFRSNFINIGYQLGYGNEEIWDFINQFFLELFEKKINPDDIRNPKAYLSVAFRRKLIDHHRMSQKNQTMPLGSIDVAEVESSPQDAIERAEVSQELLTSLKNAFEKLPQRCQRVLDLKFYNGLTTEQIALKTGLSKRSVYNNLFEGIRILRSSLKEKYPTIGFNSLLVLLPLIIYVS